MAPVHWAAGSDGETNFGLTSLAAPNAASSSVARYSCIARLTVCASSSLFHCEPGVGSLLVGVRNNQTGIHREALSADQTSPDARPHNTLEHASENVAVAEPFIAGPRKRRVIRDLVLNREPTKPAIGEVHSHITAQRSLRANRKHVADDEHPDHQHRINRWPTEPRIIRCQLRMYPTQIENRSNLAHRMIVRHRLIETK